MAEQRKTSIGMCIIEGLKIEAPGRPECAGFPTLNLECLECGSKWIAEPRPDGLGYDLQICPNAQCQKAQRDRSATEVSKP